MHLLHFLPRHILVFTGMADRDPSTNLATPTALLALLFQEFCIEMMALAKIVQVTQSTSVGGSGPQSNTK